MMIIFGLVCYRPKSVQSVGGGSESAGASGSGGEGSGATHPARKVSKHDLARARLGKIDPKVVLRSLTAELIESSSPADQISLIGVLANFRHR